MTQLHSGAVERGSLSRRSFLDILLGASFLATFVAFVACVLSYLWPRAHGARRGATQVEVADETDLPIGTGGAYAYRDTTVLVIRTLEGVKAFSAVCTHLGCIVAWNETKKQIECPCHAAAFDINGNVVAGPPPEPLARVKAAIRDGKIVVGGV